jgi:hypothetical protein
MPTSNNPVAIGPLRCGRGESLLLIAGPCVLESEELCRRVAGRFAEISAELRVPVVFKASFGKANRTSGQSFRGAGAERGFDVDAGLPGLQRLPGPAAPSVSLHPANAHPAGGREPGFRVRMLRPYAAPRYIVQSILLALREASDGIGDPERFDPAALLGLPVQKSLLPFCRQLEAMGQGNNQILIAEVPG